MNDKCWMKDYCNKIDCNSFCMRYFKLNSLYDYALIPLNKRKHIELFTDDDGSDERAFSRLSMISKDIVNYIQSGNNLFIYSNTPGNGKTQWSLRMVECYFNKIWTKATLECKVLFISVPTFLLELKQDIREPSQYIKKIKESVATCDLVIWDDIATKVGTEFELSHLLSIIDTRITNGKANIYTSNLSGADLCNALGDRLYSRIVNYSTDVIEFVGKDKRGIK